MAMGPVIKSLLDDAVPVEQLAKVADEPMQSTGWTSTGTKVNPTAKEKLINYSQSAPVEGEPPEYLAKTRVYDDTLDFTPTRILEEIQSDIDQIGAGTPYQAEWLRKGIERELNDAKAEGRDQLAIAIGGVENRAPGVEEWYQTNVKETAKNVAKSQDGEFAEKTIDGKQYAIIKPGQEGAVYTSGSAGAMAAYLAYKQGASDEDVNAQLESRGFNPVEIQQINSMAEFAAQASSQGYTDEQIQEYLESKDIIADTQAEEAVSPAEGVPQPPSFMTGQNVQPKLPFQYTTPKGSAYSDITGTKMLTPQQLYSSLRVIHPTKTSSVLVNVMSAFGNQQARRQYDYALQRSNERIIESAKQRGLDLVWSMDEISGEEGFFAQTPDGLVPVTPSFWEDFKKEAGEYGLGVAGAIAGFKMAPPNPYAKAIFSGLGAVTGAIAGTQYDYLYQAIKLQEEMTAENAWYKGRRAAEIAVIGEAIGYPAAKLTGLGWYGIKRATDALFQGNTEGAYRALKETLLMTDEEINQVVENLKRVAPDLQGSPKEQAIQAVALTEPGLQDLIRAGGDYRPQALRQATKQVQQRAEDVLATTANLSDPNVAVKFTEDLSNYVSDVKNFYNAVKAKAVQQPKGMDFEWDYEKLAIEPVLERLSKQITDPTVAQKFLLQSQRVRALSESRTFGDLIELRQLVNDFLYNKRITKAPDVDMLRGIIRNIDGAIEEGANTVMENPKQWLSDWSEARRQYTNMKKVEKTALYRMVFDRNGKVRPVQPENVVKGMLKYVTALDGSFEDVMSKVPPAGRAKYEGAVIDALANKYTIGMKDGTSVIDFTKLGDDLQKVSMTTKDARSAKKALIEMSEIFRNDPAIAQLTTKFDKPQISQGLTDNPYIKAKYELAANAYTKFRGILPGQTGRTQDLIKKTGKLLENPLNAKNAEEVMEAVSGDANLTNNILQLQREAARLQAEGVQPMNVRVYAGGKTKGTGPYTTVPLHRVATLDRAQEIADSEAITMASPDLDAILRQYGFEAIESGTDRVRILKNGRQ